MGSGVATVARLGVSIYGDVDGLKTSMAEAQSVVGAAAKEIAVSVSAVSDETDKVTAAGRRMVAALQEEVRTFGMSREEILIYKASLTGAGDEVGRLVGQLQALKAAQSAAPQLQADADATQRIKEMVAASMAQAAAMNDAAGAAQNLTTAQAGAARVTASWAESQRLQAQNMAGVAASMRSATEGTAALSAQTQIILNRYDPLGTKLRSLQSDMAVLRKEMGNSVDPAAIAAFQGLETEIEKTHALMAKAGVEGYGALEDGAQKSAFATAGATRELMVLGHEVISGNFSRIPGSILVLAERVGSFSALAEAASGFLAGMGGAAAAAVAPLALVAAAAYQGHQDILELNRALALTSNYSGQTSESMARLAADVGAAGQMTVGTAKEIVTALVASGQIGGQALASIAMLAGNYAKATRASIDEIAPKLVQLFSDPQQGAAELNKSMHFLTDVELAYIKELDESGRHQQAQLELAQDLAVHLSAQAKEVQGLAGWWHELTNAFSTYWQKAKEYYSSDDQYKVQLKAAQDTLALMLNAPIDMKQQIAEQKKFIASLISGHEAAQVAAQQTSQAASEAADKQKAITAELDKGQLHHIQLIQQEYDLLKSAPSTPAVEARKLELLNQIDSIQRAMGAEGRQLTQQQLTDQEALDLQRLKGAADGINNRYKLGEITKEQFDMNMTNNALDVNWEKQVFEMKMAHVGGLTTAERQGHIDKLKMLQEERNQIEANGAAAIGIDEKKTQDDLIKSITTAGDAEVKSLDAAIARQREHNAEIGKTKEQIELARQAEVDLDTTRKQSEADRISAGLMMGGLNEDERAAAQLRLDYLDQEIARRHTLAGLLGDGAVREADAKAAADASTAWKKAANTIENDLTNAILDGGGRGWKKLVRDMEMAFAKLVLQPILEPVSGGLATTLSPFMGNQTITGPGAAGANPLIGAAQSASSLYSAFSGGLNGTLGGGISSFGNFVGSSGISQFGSGLSGSAGAASEALGAPMTSAASAGASIAPAIPIIAASVASYFIAKGIAGQYKIEGIGTALNYLGVAGGLLNRAFGMGDKKVTDQGISGTLSADSLSGQTYSNWHQDGGWFRSDRNGTNTGALSADISKEFTQGLAAVEAASSGFAKSLGVSADWVSTYSKAFNIALTGDATKDQAAIAAFFAGIGDEIAGRLVPNLADFTKSGETAAATLQRLAGDFQGTTQVAQLLGKSAAQLFGSTGFNSAKAREGLIDAAGGLSTLSQEASTYAQNFLTDAEKLAPVQQSLSDALESLGYASLQTRDDFKAAVNGLIDSGAAATDAGAKQLSDLLALAGAFAQVHPDTTAAVLQERQGLQDQLDQLTMSSIDLLAKQRAALDQSNRSLFDQIHAAQKAASILQERQGLQDQLDQLTMSSTALLAKERDALDVSNRARFDEIQAIKAQAAAVQATKDSAASLLGGVDSAYSVLSKVVSREKQALQDQVNQQSAVVEALKKTVTAEKSALQIRIDAESAVVNRLKSLSDSIHSTLDSFKSPGNETALRQAAQAQIKAALGMVQGGVRLSDDQVASLKKAFSTVTQDDPSQFSSYDDYLRDMYQTQNDISSLSDAVDAQQASEQVTLGALQDQSSALDGAVQASQDQLEAFQSATAQQSAYLDGLLQSSQSEVDVLKGIDTTAMSIADAIGGLQSAIESAKQNPVVASSSPINDAYQSALGRAPDPTGLAYWQNDAASGIPISDIVKSITTSPEAQVRNLYETLLGRTPDAAGLNYWMSDLTSGISLSDIAASFKGSAEYKAKLPSFAAGGDFGGGWRLVGENGPELEATGPARIFNAQQTSSLMSRLAQPSDNSAALANEVKALREENRQIQGRMHKMLEDHLYALAKHAKVTADGIDGAVNGTRPLVTST